MKVEDIDKIKPENGSIFIDNLTICSAIRAIDFKYDFVEKLNENRTPIFKGIFSHDMSCLNSLIESTIFNESILTNYEYIDRWSELKSEDESFLKELKNIVIGIKCPQEYRQVIEKEIYSFADRLRPAELFSIISDSIYWETHHASFPNYLQRTYLTPYDEGHPYGSPFYLGLSTSFYLVSSQILGIPYKPSLIRSHILKEYFESGFYHKNFGASEVLIQMMENSRKEIAEKYLKEILDFNLIRLDFPMMLSFILSNCSERSKILDCAIEIRNLETTKALRNWISEFNNHIIKDDLLKLHEYYNEIKEQIKKLTNYLGFEKEKPLSIKLGWGPVEYSKSYALPKALRHPVTSKRHLLLIHDIMENYMSISRIEPKLLKLYKKDMLSLGITNTSLQFKNNMRFLE